MSLFLTGLLGQVIMALIIGSVFYNLPNDTGSLYSKGALLFFAILMAAFQSSLEVGPKLFSIESVCHTFHSFGKSRLAAEVETCRDSSAVVMDLFICSRMISNYSTDSNTLRATSDCGKAL